MDWEMTLGVVLSAAGLTVFAGWRGARPSDPVRAAILIMVVRLIGGSFFGGTGLGVDFREGAAEALRTPG